MKDVVDSKSYYYLSFIEHTYDNPGTASESLKEDILHIVKINSATGQLIYNHKSSVKPPGATSPVDHKNFRVPRKLMPDPFDKNYLFLFG